MIKVLHDLCLSQKLMQVFLAVQSNCVCRTQKMYSKKNNQSTALMRVWDVILYIPLIVFTATFTSRPSSGVKTPS